MNFISKNNSSVLIKKVRFAKRNKVAVVGLVSLLAFSKVGGVV